MRKKTKRLALHRETVRNLDDSVLTDVQGGTWTHGGPECAGTCRCLDFQDTFSGDCSVGCPYTSEG